MGKDESSSSSFPMGETAQEKSFSHVPQCYTLPTSNRPSLNPETVNVHVVDWAALNNPDQRSHTINEIKIACSRSGCFQITNHGIAQSVLDAALETAFNFFKMPTKEKMKYMSNDVHKSVRYGTSLKDGLDKLQYWRVFLKHYAHPLHQWIQQWPINPPEYRQQMGKFATEVNKVAADLMKALTESLGLGPTYLSHKMENGMQVMVINCYPPCPEPSLSLGLPPHSDYSCFTIVLHSFKGLEILDKSDGTWKVVPDLHGALTVHVGDHIEVLSNGIYKSMVHRVTLNRNEMRISIASLHSLGMDEKMETAKELVDSEHPKGYKESSFMDFLNFLSRNDIAEESFIETLKLKN
ncbi:flavanone 3-dioxygenase 3 [Apium graveolens]|uniref:flavanone 3-dioxygenase 3 n=1 Tax=Apium graveolens TaxID=4045 RepID=UPI003D7AFE65